MIRVAALFLVLTTVSSCAPNESERPDSVAAKACVGGFMAQRGLTPWPTCIIPFADAGKSCTDKADCRGQCLVKYERNLALGSPAVGQCQAEEPAVGCFAQVRQGAVATGFRCID